jgi:hypothetical protein
MRTYSQVAEAIARMVDGGWTVGACPDGAARGHTVVTLCKDGRSYGGSGPALAVALDRALDAVLREERS